jgi:Ca-activated chloride channel family protein
MSDRAVAALLAFVLFGSVRPPVVAGAVPDAATPVAIGEEVTQGALRVTRGGAVVECPLRHTDVQAEVSGFLARVRVTQTFENPFDEAIEAVYVFPLPHTAAVDGMTMVVGGRRVVGRVERRAEARDLYRRALAGGYTASLLEQERPNIFTQTVGNVRPQQTVRMEISYVDVLPYDQGAYEFHFPMVVGPRYIPGRPLPGRDRGQGWSPDTTRVPDASRITPPVLEPGQRTGHDVSLRVSVDAGVPIRDVAVAAHAARVDRPGRSRAVAVLSRADAIPNKDFVMTYKVAGERPETAVLAHAAPGEPGYFLLMMQPRDVEEALRTAPPRDVCFLIDVSGSMSGQPTAKVIEAMQRFFERMRPEDRLQVITFASSTSRVFDGYVPADAANVRAALRFTDGLRGGGGTEMLKGIQAVLADPVDSERVRVVVMLTDGYIGNEAEIAGEVGRRAGDQLRFWTVGIGASPNRYLLDAVARQGGGASAVMGLNDDPTELVGRIMERIQRAQLSRIQLDWGSLDVSETYPARVPELWAGRPVVVLGRYVGSGPTVVRIAGVAEGQPVSFPVEVAFPESEPAHGVLAAAWARRKIEDLSDQMALAHGDLEPLEQEITDVALRYRLMSAYTSFVAVDEAEGPAGQEPRPPRRLLVPLPLPEGVSYEGVFGGRGDRAVAEEGVVADSSRESRKARRAEPLSAAIQRVGPGMAGGVVGGVVGGVPAGPPPPPPLPAATSAPGHPAPGAGVSRRRAPVFRAEAAQNVDIALRHIAEARTALSRARAAADKQDWRGARREAQLAWALMDASGRPWADNTQAEAAELAATADRHLREAAMAAQPALRKRLDIVVRNASLSEAVEQLAAAAGVRATIVPGALSDAAMLVGRAPRVAWLDLRRASAAQAMSWLVQPAGLEWTVEGGAIVVRSPRGAAPADAWSYLAPPVEAGAAARARAAAAVARLDRHSWALLAAALLREVDDEAASEMLEAAGEPAALELLAKEAPAALLRAGWAVGQARAARPSDPALRALSARLATASGPPLPPAPGRVSAAYRALLGALPAELRPAAVPPATAVEVNAALDAVARAPIRDGDAALLAELRARLSGRAAWNAARDTRPDRLAGVPIGAGALRALNRLDRARLAGL